MYVYETNPIDAWDAFVPLEEILGRAPSVTTYGRGDLVRQLMFACKAVATLAAWEGDVREGPYVIPIPGGEWGAFEPELAFAWKQGNNGTTFIVSPVELPWLNSCLRLRPQVKRQAVRAATPSGPTKPDTPDNSARH